MQNNPSQEEERIKQLRNYIKQHFERGISEHKIKEMLISAGWLENLVEEEIRYIFHIHKKKYYERFIFGTVIVIILIMFIIVIKDYLKSILYLLKAYIFFIGGLVALMVATFVIIKKVILKRNVDAAQASIDQRHHMSTEEYDTTFDKLHAMVEEKGTLKVSEVAQAFGISNKIAEEWAEILAEHELAQLHFPIFGEAELRKWNK